MPSNIRPVGRKRINDEEMPARFPKGTLARLDALLEEKERRSDFIRRAVEDEIVRRESIREAVEREIRRREALGKRRI
jgi:metal-responsive CopG/Arc/MetJ family transcriptional regulator